MSLSLGLQPQLGGRTLIQRAIASLRARGSDAHLWLPGGDVKTYGAEFLSTYDFTTWTTAGGVSGSTANSITTTSAGGVLSSAGVVSVGTTYLIVAVGTTTATKFNIRNPGTLTNSGSALTGAFTISFHSTWSDIGQLYLQNESAGTTTITSFSIKQVTSITPTITSGLTTGNYLESTGNSVATVNNPCGLVLDALGTVGAELVPALSDGSWLVTNAAWASSGGNAVATSCPTDNSFYRSGSVEVGKTYLYSITISSISAGGIRVSLGNVFSPTYSTVGTFTGYIVPTTNSNSNLNSTGLTTATVTSFSVREVTGIHLSQATTAYKPILQKTDSKYSWTFDEYDFLQSNKAPFQLTDDFAVIATVKVAETPGTYWDVIFCASAATPARIYYLFDQQNITLGCYFTDDAGNSKSFTYPIDLRGVHAVLSLVKIGSIAYLFVNGVQVASTSVATLGVSTFTAATIGNSQSGADAFKGNIYYCNPIKGTLSASDLLICEIQAARAAGITF